MTGLDKTKEIVYSDREKEYGHPAVNHLRTAIYWSQWLHKRVTPRDVCMLNILQKVSRAHNMFTEDTILDIEGFAENIYRIDYETLDDETFEEVIRLQKILDSFEEQ